MTRIRINSYMGPPRILRKPYCKFSETKNQYQKPFDCIPACPLNLGDPFNLALIPTVQIVGETGTLTKPGGSQIGLINDIKSKQNL